MPPVLGFRLRCSSAKPSNKWRADGRQAMGHSTGWKVNINVDKDRLVGIDGASAFVAACSDSDLKALAHSAHRHRHAHIPPSSASRELRQLHCRRDTPFHALASLVRPANPSLHGMSFQLGFLLALSSMRAPPALIFSAFYV